MAFIDQTQNRAQLQDVIPDDGKDVPSFSEVFQANVGFAIDEGLSISRFFNDEQYGTRRARVKEIFDSGVNRDEFTNDEGEIDYNRMSEKYEGIATDQELKENKNIILKQRREYYQELMSRSNSPVAEFLGTANAFMLDPINVATMTVGTPFAVAKGVGVIGRALSGGLGAAVINAGTEALIQPAVLDYKLEIDSPYTTQDAINNIAMAAGGGFILGGIAGGISGYLKRVRKEATGIKIDENINVDELTFAVHQVDEMIETLSVKGDFDIELAKTTALDNIKTDLAEKSENIINDLTVKQLKEKAKQLEESQLISSDVEISKQIDTIYEALERYDAAFKASAELEQINKGEIPEHIAKQVEEDANTAQIKSDADHLRMLDEEAEKLNKTPEKLEYTRFDEIKDEDLDGIFRAGEDDLLMVKDGDLVKAKEFINQLDNDIDAIEAIRVCSLG